MKMMINPPPDWQKVTVGELMQRGLLTKCAIDKSEQWERINKKLRLIKAWKNF